MNAHFPAPIRLSRPHKQMLHAVFAALWLSGVLWLVFHFFLQIQGEFGEAAHPLEYWWLRLHGLLVFASLVMLGSILPIHVGRAWQLKKNRRSGLMMKGAFLWLAVSGYALYYFAAEGAKDWLSIMHWGAGLLLPALLLFHIQSGRTRPQSERWLRGLSGRRP